MKAAERYSEILDNWDEQAAKQEWASDWEEAKGSAITEYLRECITESHAPTFLGLILYLCTIAPDVVERSAK